MLIVKPGLRERRHDDANPNAGKFKKITGEPIAEGRGRPGYIAFMRGSRVQLSSKSDLINHHGHAHYGQQCCMSDEALPVLYAT